MSKTAWVCTVAIVACALWMGGRLLNPGSTSVPAKRLALSTPAGNPSADTETVAATTLSGTPVSGEVSEIAEERSELEQTRRAGTTRVQPSESKSPSPSGSSSPRILTGTVRDSVRPNPIAHVTVSAGNDSKSATAETGRDGGFRLVLDFSPVYVHFTAEGFLPHHIDWRGEPELLPGDARDTGPVLLTPGARVMGVVLDPGGRPVPGAHVFLTNFGLRDMRSPVIMPSATTDEDGTFQLPRTIPFQGTGNMRRGLLAIGAENEPDGALLGWNELPLFEDGKNEIALELHLEFGAALKVLVRDSRAHPIDDVRVRLHPEFEPFDSLDPFHKMARSHRLGRLFERTTDEKGEAQFNGLPLDSERPAHEASPYVVWLETSAGPVLQASFTLERRGNELELDIDEQYGRALAGIVTDEHQRPLAGVLISADGLLCHSTTDGSFRLEGLDPSKNTTDVDLAHEGYANVDVNIDWERTEDPERLEFVLSPLAPIAGQVIDQTGQPVEHARLFLNRYRDGLRFQTQTETDEDGAFRFAKASSGKWHLHVWPPTTPGTDLGDWKGVRHLQVIGGNEKLKIVLERQASGQCLLQVTVIDAETGAVLTASDAHLVSLQVPEPGGNVPIPPSVRREASRLVVTDLRPGEWRMWARTETHAPGFVDMVVGRNAVKLDETLTLGDSGGLRGRVIAPDDINLYGAVLTLQLAAGPRTIPGGPAWESVKARPSQVALGADGQFEFLDVLPGPVQLELHHFALVGLFQEHIPHGRTHEVSLHATVAAQLLLSGHAPAAEGFVFIHVENEDGFSKETLWAKIEGHRYRYKIPVPPGRIQWRAWYTPEQSPGVPASHETSGVAFTTAGQVTPQDGGL